MSAPYSTDLLKKALATVEAGHSVTSVRHLFGIARRTLKSWRRPYRETGELAAKQGYQCGHSHKNTDWPAFPAFAETHGDKTQAEMAQL
ncbi:MAG: helix-turn-helix domain-containing protein [Leptolyngbya sp. SIOISBB]|nr:helix-turn-helix domain-containing protein [Leptolyngbya sp. SIOISBB]